MRIHGIVRTTSVDIDGVFTEHVLKRYGCFEERREDRLDLHLVLVLKQLASDHRICDERQHLLLDQLSRTLVFACMGGVIFG